MAFKTLHEYIHVAMAIERLWRSLKYEEVYLKAYETPKQAEQEIGQYFQFYNERRRHQALDYLTPDEVYDNLPQL